MPMHAKAHPKAVGVLDTAENRIRLPSALGHTLQRLSAHRTMRESSLGMGMGGYLTCWGTWSSWKCCFHQGVCNGWVPPETELGRGRK